MARGIRTSTDQLKRKVSKAEIAARQEAESLLVTNQTTPKASPLLNTEERKIFNKLKKRNGNYTENDSESLNLLSQYLHIWTKLKQAHNGLDIADEDAPDLEKRMIAIDKQISQHMSALAIPLSQRFRLANDMAKVMIEEKKLEQMEQQNKPQEVNPALAILEAFK
jgi:DNA repair ATPase RecN